MKTKILSLALALMMIISVAAALPVSADVVEPIIVGAANMSYNVLGGGPYADTVPSDDYGWVPNGHIMTSSSTATTITSTIEVKSSGYYELYIVSSKVSKSYQGNAFELYCGDTWLMNFGPELGADTEIDVAKQTKAGTVYLEAGSHTIKMVAQGKSAINFYAYKFEYLGTTAPTTIISSAISGSTVNSGGGPYHYTVPSDDFGWIPNGSVIFSTNTATTHKVNVLQAGTYELTIGAQSYNTSACNVKVTVGEGTAKTVTFAAQSAKNLSVQSVVGTYDLNAGENIIKVARSSGYTYYQGLKLTKIETCTITANKTEGGTVTGAGIVRKGGNATLTATANAGYMLEGWYENGAKVSGATSYTVENVTADRTFTAKFVKGVVVPVWPVDTTYENNATGGYATPNNTTVPSNKNGVDWVPNGSFLMGSKTHVRYNVSGLEAGYYDMYVAFRYASKNTGNNVVLSFHQGDEPINTSVSAVTAGLSSTAPVVEAKVGKIYIPAGGYSFRVDGVGTGNGYVQGYRLTYSDDQTEPPPSAVVLDLGSAARPNGIGGGPWANTQADSNSWIIGQSVLISGAKTAYDEKQKLELSATVAKDGWYDIYVGAYQATIGGTFYGGKNFLMDLWEGDNKLAENVSLGDLAGYTSTAAKSYGQASNGNNVYRVQLKTVAGAGEVKAFLWKANGTYAPLAATATLNVN